MPLVRLGLENYRCFSTRQEIEIRPITVVLGKNNSGKSARVRSPLILAIGLANDSPLPLDLAQLGEDAPEFVDLVHRRVEHGSITLTADFSNGDDDRLALSATIQNIAEWYSQLVSRWSLKTTNMEMLMEWTVEDSDQSPPRYVLSGEDAVPVTFEGLLPLVEPLIDHEMRERIRSSLGEVRHLGPFRTRPARIGRVLARAPSQDETGGRTAEILIHDHVRRGGRVIEKINEYLAGYLPGWELEVVQRYDAFAVGLRSCSSSRSWNRWRPVICAYPGSRALSCGGPSRSSTCSTVSSAATPSAACWSGKPPSTWPAWTSSATCQCPNAETANRSPMSSMVSIGSPHCLPHCAAP